VLPPQSSSLVSAVLFDLGFTVVHHRPTFRLIRSPLRALGGHLHEISPGFVSFRLSMLFVSCFTRSMLLVDFSFVWPNLAGLALDLCRCSGKIRFLVVRVVAVLLWY
jgi:hypothetical protein